MITNMDSVGTKYEGDALHTRKQLSLSSKYETFFLLLIYALMLIAFLAFPKSTELNGKLLIGLGTRSGSVLFLDCACGELRHLCFSKAVFVLLSSALTSSPFFVVLHLCPV